MLFNEKNACLCLMTFAISRHFRITARFVRSMSHCRELRAFLSTSSKRTQKRECALERNHKNCSSDCRAKPNHRSSPCTCSPPLSLVDVHSFHYCRREDNQEMTRIWAADTWEPWIEKLFFYAFSAPTVLFPPPEPETPVY